MVYSSPCSSVAAFIFPPPRGIHCLVLRAIYSGRVSKFLHDMPGVPHLSRTVQEPQFLAWGPKRHLLDSVAASPPRNFPFGQYYRPISEKVDSLDTENSFHFHFRLVGFVSSLEPLMVALAFIFSPAGS
ncbi:hypothetical protein J3458_012905 [Metarhizium acridum]|uniref:uncharacterized protein n=1 Tax=Metarhizium acridum TaxID=92637 RepID=UPI001C6B5815|nr:hypothetical protein J3458_012905 [Metarhizium acridum]